MTLLRQHLPEQARTYERQTSVVFLKTKEAFGGLSNMAGGYPLRVNRIVLLTSEALYQACRFPHLPDVQRIILAEKSPMTAKMRTKPYRADSRPDWDHVRVKIMRWCLRVKLALHWDSFGELLLSTEERPIVEESRKDDFWGAKPTDSQTLVGMNVLGRLLMELREAIKTEPKEALLRVEPLNIQRFLLLDAAIETVVSPTLSTPRTLHIVPAFFPTPSPPPAQISLFDTNPPSHAERADTVIPSQLHTANTASPPHVLDTSMNTTTTEPSTATTEPSLPHPPRNPQPYPAYKASGSPWIGQVPEHWEVKQAKHLGSFFKGVGGTKEDNVLLGVPCVRYGDLYTTHHSFIRRSKVFVHEGRTHDYTPIQYGDVLFAASGETIEEIGKSAVNLMRESAVCGGDTIILRPNSFIYPPFLGYATDCRTSQTQKAMMGRGTTVKHIYPSELKNLLMPLPPLEEQAAMVRYLDDACGRLDRAIRAKRKMLALLHEQKQAIIHRAVTQGLDPHAPRKPSGIPWLGEIPQHWEVLRLGRVTNLITGYPFKSECFTQKESATRLLRGINVTPAGLRWDSTVRWERAYNDGLDVFCLEVGDIILGMDRPIIASGVRAAQVEAKDVPSLLLQRVARIRPTERLDNSFLLMLLRGKLFAYYIAPIFTGISVPHLSPEQILNFKIVLPPKSEQSEIVRYVEAETVSLNTAIARIEREIALLQEYRTRLVSDVVTGKWDVREAAKHVREISYGEDAVDGEDVEGDGLVEDADEAEDAEG
ncbi:NADAR domain-containing protein [Myxococcota bacterium]|nr:NADAR domain-containing protein [Myxococcota bacterium]